jgi:hypothetical protein
MIFLVRTRRLADGGRLGTQCSSSAPPGVLANFRFRVLDECDEMLNMGFADDVEAILKSAQDSSSVQTLLFSATMPSWVKDMQRKYLNAGSVYVDLVGNDKMKASKSVEHKVLYAHWSQRTEIIQDLVNCYGFSGAREALSCPVVSKPSCPEMATVLGGSGPNTSSYSVAVMCTRASCRRTPRGVQGARSSLATQKTMRMSLPRSSQRQLERAPCTVTSHRRSARLCSRRSRTVSLLCLSRRTSQLGAST